MIEFTSNQAPTLLMFEDNAINLLKMMKVSGHIPAAVQYEDLDPIIMHLTRSLANLKAHNQIHHQTHHQDQNESDHSEKTCDHTDLPQIQLEKSAYLLLEMIKHIADQKGFLQWNHA